VDDTGAHESKGPNEETLMRKNTKTDTSENHIQNQHGSLHDSGGIEKIKPVEFEKSGKEHRRKELESMKPSQQYSRNDTFRSAEKKNGKGPL
jgi:hypothetical protein